MNKKKEKEITNTELLLSINRSFSKVEEKIEKIDTKVERLDVKVEGLNVKVEGLKSQIAGVNNRIDDISLNRVRYEDFNKLTIRVEKLEKAK